MPIFFIVGTRPEAIKLLPLLTLFKKRGLPAFLCLSMQHEAMVLDLLKLFECTADFTFSFEARPRTLNELTAALLAQFDALFTATNPSYVFIQGDTATVFAGALAAFNRNIPIAHVEAGLRTYNLQAPFPEEGYRQMVSRIATTHYAPTQEAASNLISEGIAPETVVVTGNTVVDALHQTLARISSQQTTINTELQYFCETAHATGKKLFLLTAHRRESHGKPLEEIFTTLLLFLQSNPHVMCVYATHPNPAIKQALVASGFLEVTGKINPTISNQIFYTQPLPYPELIYTLNASTCVVTDSGGIQEEAIALGKRVICLRKTTERPEGIALGLTTLVSSNPTKLTWHLTQNLFTRHTAPAKHASVYGDGTASEKIFQHFISIYSKSAIPSAPRASTRKTKEM